MPEHVYLSTQLDEFILLPYDAHTHTQRDTHTRNIYLKNIIGRGEINTCLQAPNIHFYSLLINMNGKNFVDSSKSLKLWDVSERKGRDKSIRTCLWWLQDQCQVDICGESNEMKGNLLKARKWVTEGKHFLSTWSLIRKKRKGQRDKTYKALGKRTRS